MADEDVAWYQRLLDAQPDLVDFPWCWTVVQPLTKPVTVAEVARRLGGDPANIEELAGWDFEAPDGTVHLQRVGKASATRPCGGYPMAPRCIARGGAIPTHAVSCATQPSAWY